MFFDDHLFINCIHKHEFVCNELIKLINWLSLVPNMLRFDKFVSTYIIYYIWKTW
jgi:hypothetical protein